MHTARPIGTRPELAGIIATGLLVVGCQSLTSGEAERTFVFPIHELKSTDEIAATDTLEVRLYGTIGPDLCHSLDHIAITRLPDELHVTGVGRFESHGACATAVSELRGELVLALPPLLGPFRVVAHQPDGSIVVREVTVVP